MNEGGFLYRNQPLFVALLIGCEHPEQCFFFATNHVRDFFADYTFLSKKNEENNGFKRLY